MRVTFVGKSGAGKSTLAGLMCWALARHGDRVLAVDADGVPGLAPVLGLEVGDEWFLVDAAVRREDGRGWDLTMTAQEAIERHAISGPGGIRYLQVGKLPALELTDRELAAFVAFARLVPEFDDADGWVVVDTYGGTLQATAGWTGPTGVVLVIVEPFAKSVLTAARLAGLARWQPGARLLGVASKIASDQQRRWLTEELARVGIPMWAEVPADPAVADAERGGMPLVQLPAGSPAVAAATSIADRLRADRGGVDVVTAGEGRP